MENESESRDAGTIVSYPNRCPLWGDAKYRGNCDGRLLKQLIIRYRPRSIADPMEGSGTSRDLVAWWNRGSKHQIDYWGGDLRKGFNLLKQDIPGRHDLVWIHPPYWNIIRYNRHPDDLSSFEYYSMFRDALRLCLVRCYMATNPSGRLAILIGDVRRKGRYYPIVRDILNLEGEIGELRSIIIKAQHHCRSDGVQYATMEDARIQHEYCLIFKRPGFKLPAHRAA